MNTVLVDAGAWVPLAAAEVALLALLSVARSWVRSRRPAQASWTVALIFATVGAAALWYGCAFGWSATSFRLYYVGGGLFVVPWLALGQVQLLVPPRTGEVAFVLLFLASAVCGALVGLQGLRGTVSGTAVPDGASLLPALPTALVAFSNGAGTVVLLGGLAVSLSRSRRAGPAGRSRAVGLALVAAGALVAGAGGALTVAGRATANAAGVLVGLTLIAAGARRTSRPVGRHRGMPS